MAADEAGAIKKLLGLLQMDAADANTVHIFDAREVATIKRMIAAYEGWESVGRLGRSVRSMLMLIGFFVMAFAVVKGWLADWIKLALLGGHSG